MPLFSSRPRRRRGAALASLESLESRELLAGNVNVVVDGIDIRVIGNDAGNEIQVEGVGGTLRISGVNGTTVNWKRAPVEFDLTAGEFGDLRFALNAGDDIVNITGDIEMPGRLILYGHAGGDQFSIDGNLQFGGDMVIAGGANGDIIDLAGLFAGDKLIVNGDDSGILNHGDDIITLINSSSLRDTKVLLGLGTNLAKLTKVAAGQDLRMWGSGGADEFVLSRVSSVRDLIITGANGLNQYGLAGLNVGRDLKINGGTNSDIVALNGGLIDILGLGVGSNSIGRNLSMILGGGNDDIRSLGSHVIDGAAYLYGMDGDDRFSNLLGLALNKIATQSSFEGILNHTGVLGLLTGLENKLKGLVG